MQYDRFDDLITQKHGIIVKNWPLKRFCNPSAVATRIELDVLFNSWESGATRFQKLSRDEMRAWEKERFSSRVAMMTASPSSPSTPVTPSPTTCSAPTAPDNVMPVPSDSIPPEPASPAPPEMVLVSELTEQDAPQSTSNDIGQGVAPSLASAAQLPAPDSELVAEIIRQDPTLQSIDPALIVTGLTQGHHRPATASPPVNTEHPPHPTPLISQNKRNLDAFQIATPASFHARATKKSRREQKGGKAKKKSPAGENVSPGEGAR